jgi:hypothetical protein
MAKAWVLAALIEDSEMPQMPENDRVPFAFGYFCINSPIGNG